MRMLYATDASVYRELPQAVALPKSTADIQQLIKFARLHNTFLIPRAAGTSLAGQCVGSGIVVDISRYGNQILELNREEAWIRLQGGVIRDELNAYLKPHGLWFGVNTSTANRAMIGGMVGNNSCGSTSIVYGSTRDHLLEVKAVLSDGTEAVFGPLHEGAFFEKCKGSSLENRLYQQIWQELSQPKMRKQIEQGYPKASIQRRNTGYAVDALLPLTPFDPTGKPFNFCKILAGSEGTLAIVTEIKLHLDPLPPPDELVMCVHFHQLQEALEAVLVVMRHRPYACELMDRIVLDCTKNNIEQQKNRFFVKGDPAAVLLVELRADSLQELNAQAEQLKGALQAQRMGYAFPLVRWPASKRVWALRRAGLGLLANLPGDRKAVACIEDTAVDLPDLPAYIAEFDQLMERYQQQAVHYAHAGAGELHLRPILDLKDVGDRRLFRQISEESAALVRRYRGSLSGEHGDGRVRSEFIPKVLGEENYQLLRRIKQLWDPANIFNPGKIVDAVPMDSNLRYQAAQSTPAFDTLLDFSSSQGILRMAEKCNGSGDCRKLPFSGGTMCPSYMATRNEKDTTRARANALRELLSQPDGFTQPFAKTVLNDVLELCLSCKGCTSECPSNVDMASMKAEFQYQYYQNNRRPLRDFIFANYDRLNRLAAIWPGGSNFLLSNTFTGGLLKRMLGIAPQRQLPGLHRQSLRSWFEKHCPKEQTAGQTKGEVFFFCDEFTNFNDTAIGIKAIRLLWRLGYLVSMPQHAASGRAHISKGFLKEARQLAQRNVAIFKDLVSAERPLIGLEPSALLSFRDEYPRLVDPKEVANAKKLGQNCLLIEEFLEREMEAGRITAGQFSDQSRKLLLHGHCHQKALASVAASARILELPVNYSVEVIPSGCCGMAGSFGYEKEHFEVSRQIGELVLFPAIRQAAEDVLIVAPGTSCRYQIRDALGRKAYHPVELLLGDE